MIREKTAVQVVQKSVDILCSRNEHLKDKKAGQVFIGNDVVVIQLVQPVVIEGKHYEAAKTVDIMELIRQAEEEAWA